MAHLRFLPVLTASLAVGIAITSASDTLERAHTRAPQCMFTGSDGASQVVQHKNSCSEIVLANVAVPAGSTLDLTGLNEGTLVTFEGTTSFGYQEWSGPLVSVSGKNITVTGSPQHVLDGNGSRWWDGGGSNSGKTKPKFFFAHNLVSSTISELYIKDSPVQIFSVYGANRLSFISVTVDNKAGDNLGAHNTDAFDIGSSNGVRISGATVYNQDDCVAVNSGTDITFTNGFCSGGHGLSIGSVGGRSDNTVDTVHFNNSQVANSQNGIRIKTAHGANGSVKSVTYSKIELSNITDYGIIIGQGYQNNAPTTTPTNGVPITDLTVSGVHGTVASSATDVYILCAAGACSNWTWSSNSVTGGKRSNACENVPSGVSC